MKKRYDFMNVLRLVSMLFIVFYHMVVTLYIFGIRQLESVEHFYSNKNLHIATIGVGLFFMLSGAGLMLGARENKNFSAWSFYKKRFFKILVPFYIVYLSYLAFTLIYSAASGMAPLDVFKPYPAMWKAVFTFLGMDAYIGSFGIRTFSLGIGEWFLGCLVLMYICFPLLRKCMLKNKYLTLLLSTFYFIVIVSVYKYFPFAEKVPGFVNFPVKIYDFILGMFFGLLLDDGRNEKEVLPKWSIVLAGVITLVYIICPVAVPINENVKIVILNTAIFMLAISSESLLEKAPGLMKPVGYLCGFTYEFFLIHHVVIDFLTMRRVGKPFGNLEVMVLFIEEFLITVVLTVLVKGILKLPALSSAKKQKSEEHGKI